MTVNRVSRSEFSVFGSTEEIARAADAPQIATAPPVRMPKSHLRPNSRASSRPAPMVIATHATTSMMGPVPSAKICDSVTRTPSRATPTRSSRLDVKLIPGTQRPSTARKWNAMPSSSANSITGAV